MLLDQDPAHAFMPYPAVEPAHAGGGPLAGLTFAVKDLFDVAGYPTSAGSPVVLALSGIKPRHAEAVRLALDAGGRFVGKTVSDELAYSLNGRNIHFGTPRNGAAPDRIPGGSSSGSASAVSNGLCDVALGTDTGGSVRAPASHCGLYGLRPTHGRISLDGCARLAPGFDTVGFFARTGAHFLRAGQAWLGRDAAPLPASPRLLRAAEAFALADPGAQPALAEAQARIERRLGPAGDASLGPVALEDLHWAFRYLQADEAWREHRDFLLRYGPPLEPAVAQRFAWGRDLDPAQVENARKVQADWRRRLAGLLGGDGVLLLPTMPASAPRLDEQGDGLESYRYRAVHLLCLAGLAGFPQATLPLARHDGAPLGISLIGPPGSDLSLVELAAAIAPADPSAA